MNKINFVILLALCLSACAVPDISEYTDTGSATSYSSTQHRPTKPANVELYYSDLPKNFKVIGRVSADNDNYVGIPRFQKAIELELKSQAAKLGANAVINIQKNSKSTTGQAVIEESSNVGN